MHSNWFNVNQMPSDLYMRDCWISFVYSELRKPKGQEQLMLFFVFDQITANYDSHITTQFDINIFVARPKIIVTLNIDYICM